MQTLAAAMSAHWCYLSGQLYSETRSLLETQSQMQANPRDKVPLEQIQTWLLLSHYELLRVGIHQAMLTAGRAFRLVQMARLSYIDTPGGDMQVSNLVSSSFLVVFSIILFAFVIFFLAAFLVCVPRYRV
jgi:hypothetical protein